MVRIHDLLLKKPGYYMVMQVHDELVFDFPKGTGKEPWQTNLPLIKTIKGLMEQGGTDIGIPTPVSCEYHPVSWDVGLTIKV
jgi:DNA polymerase I-like protein with 3'-5' exonuclease and polymerase domains